MKQPSIRRRAARRWALQPGRRRPALFCSGQGPDPATGQLVEGASPSRRSDPAQPGAVLEAAGLD